VLILFFPVWVENRSQSRVKVGQVGKMAAKMQHVSMSADLCLFVYVCS
jgi:hypothetical protein